jgi:hypothetical protein
MQHNFSASIPHITALTAVSVHFPTNRKKKNFTGLALMRIAGAILGTSLVLLATITNMAAYMALACTVVFTKSRTTVEAAVQKPQMKSGKLPVALSASLSHCRNIFWHVISGAVEYQHISHFAYRPACSFRGCNKLKRIPFLETAHHTGYTSAEKRGVSRRYQNSIEKFFLIPCRYQFSIGEFFLIPWWYQFQIQDFFLIPQRCRPG